MNAFAWSALPAGSRPKSRYSAPIGAFDERSTVTVPTTGARSTLMPAALSCVPHADADCLNWLTSIAPCWVAEGSGIEPGPLEMLDQTTLLIGGHQQLVVARSIRLQRGCGGRDPGGPPNSSCR